MGQRRQIDVEFWTVNLLETSGEIETVVSG